MTCCSCRRPPTIAWSDMIFLACKSHKLSRTTYTIRAQIFCSLHTKYSSGERCWNSDGHPLTRLSGHLADVTSICIRDSTQQLITTSTDGLIFVWSHEEGRTVDETSAASSSAATSRILSYGSGFLGRSADQSYSSGVLGAASNPAEDVDAWSSDDEASRFVPPIVHSYLRNPRSRLAQSVAARHVDHLHDNDNDNDMSTQNENQNSNNTEWLRESMPLFEPSFQRPATSSSFESAAGQHTSSTTSGQAVEERIAGGFIPDGAVHTHVEAPAPTERNTTAKRRISIRAKLTKKMKRHNR